MKTLTAVALMILGTMNAAAFAEAKQAKRGVAQANWEPIEEDTSTATSGYSLRQKRGRKGGDWLSLFHVAPVAGYVYTNWKGVSSTPASVTSVASGGTVSAKDGYGGGVQVLVGNGQFQFESGLIYAMRSISYTGALKDQNGNPISYNGDINENVSYLDIPLMARFAFMNPRRSHFFVHAGAVVGVMLEQSAEVSNPNYGFQTGYFYPPQYQGSQASASGTLGDLNTVDFRGRAGLGGVLKIDRSIYLTLQADYEHSVSKINSSGPDSLMLEGFGVFTGVVFDL